MGLSASVSPVKQTSRLFVELARGADDVRVAQALRYQVFAKEMGATLKSGETGLDADEFDPYCRHLLVRESETGRVVGCTRILTDRNADRIGRLYSEGELSCGPFGPCRGACWRWAAPVSPPNTARAPRSRCSGPVWPASSTCTGMITCLAALACRWESRTCKRRQS